MYTYEKLFVAQENLFKVLANHKRLEIVQLLTYGELSVNEMAEMLGIAQTNISQHLSILRQAVLVETRKSGKSIYYRLADKRIAKACHLIRQVLFDQNAISKTSESILKSNKAKLYPLVQDPVCKMRFSLAESLFTYSYNAKTYYFCASGCQKKFITSPKKYISQ